MAIKEITSSILKRLEEGTAQIYSQYEKLINASRANLHAKKKDLEKQYTAAANDAAATARIGLKNTLEKMADSGYVRSGETVQATLASNANKARALSTLALQKARDVASLESQGAQEELSLSQSAQKEAAQLRDDTLKTLLEQENRDREFQALEEQRRVENARAQEEIALKREEILAQKAASEAKEKEEKQKGIIPEKSAYEYLDDIVERNTKNYPKKGYKVVDRKAIYKAVDQIIRDTSLSQQYRYEMYLYAKSLGYLD